MIHILDAILWLIFLPFTLYAKWSLARATREVELLKMELAIKNRLCVVARKIGRQSWQAETAGISILHRCRDRRVAGTDQRVQSIPAAVDRRAG